MPKANFRHDFYMPKGKANGYFHVRNIKGYGYISFINNTSAIIDVYQEITTQKSGAYLFTCPPRGQYTVPIASRPDFTFFYEHNSQNDEVFSVIWSEENLGFNATYVLPTQTTNVILTQDSIGLAKASQLPASLSNGWLGVEVRNQPTVNIGSMPPINLGSVTIENSLPAGNNLIGKVDINSMPPISVGEITISGSLPAGTNNIGSVNIAGANAQNNRLFVSDAPLATGIKTGSVTVGTSATQLPNQVIIDGVAVLKAAKANTDVVLIGDSTEQNFELDAGELFTFPVDNLSKLYAKAATGSQKIIWLVGV